MSSPRCKPAFLHSFSGSVPPPGLATNYVCCSSMHPCCAGGFYATPSNVTVVLLTCQDCLVSKILEADENTIHVWGISNGKQLHALYGLTQDISILSISPDGTLVAAAADKAITVWRIDTGEVNMLCRQNRIEHAERQR